MGSSQAEPANDEVDLGYSKGDLKRIAWLLKALKFTRHLQRCDGSVEN